MGYYVTGEGTLKVKKALRQQAYEAMCALNDLDDLKRGGSWPRQDTRPEGATFDPSRWFSWMDADYPSTLHTMEAILEALGFELDDMWGVHEDHCDYALGESIEYRVSYDSKIGQEELFFRALAPFLEYAQIEWVGEDNEQWKWEVTDGQFVMWKGMTTWVQV